MRAKEQLRWTAVSIGLSLMLCNGMGFGARLARASEFANDTGAALLDGGEAGDVGEELELTQTPVSVSPSSSIRVTGVDYVFGSKDAEDSTIDICSVTGAADDTVYVEMRRNGTIIASHMPFVVGNESEGENGAYVGVLSLILPSFDPKDEYTIKVYEDRSQKLELYAGSIVPVYAQLDEGGDGSLIAVRTIGDEKRTFQAPSTISRENATYALTSKKAISEDPLTYAYALSDGTAVEGKVTYVDDEGTELKLVTAGSLEAGSSKEVDIPAIISVGEGTDVSFWRTVSFTNKVTLSFPGQSEYTIPCKPLTGPDGVDAANAGSYYLATINLVDSEGKRLGTDTLNVTSAYLYTAPQRLHVTSTNGAVDTYEISDSNTILNDAKVLALDPAKDNVTDGQKSFDIVYDKLSDDAERTWTVKIVNGAADPDADNRVIDTKKFSVMPGDTATFTPEAKLSVNGVDYVPVSSTKESYSYTYGDIPEAGQQSVYPTLTVYYVPDGYVDPEPYEIEIRYVNIANGKVIETRTLTSRPELRDELEITSPATFTVDGVEYIRLDGQEQSLWHSFYSSARVYTIYYRDINDDLHAETTITRVNVEYVDGETTETDGGTRTIDDGTTYTDGGTTTTNGGTTTTNNGRTVTNNGTTGNSGTNVVDEGTTYTNNGGGTTTTNEGAPAQQNGTSTTSYADGGTSETVNPGQTTYGGTNATAVGLADGAPAANVGATAGTTDTADNVAAGASDGATAGSGNGTAQTARIPTSSDTLTVINGGDSATMTDSAGRDTNTMRIEDDATPLAGPSSGTESSVNDAASKVSHVNALAGIVAALAAAIGIVFFIFYKRRQSDDEVEEAPEDTDVM